MIEPAPSGHLPDLQTGSFVHYEIPATEIDGPAVAVGTADPGYHPGQCKPETFKCSCGKQYAHVCDEAEGCWWEAMTP